MMALLIGQKKNFVWIIKYSWLKLRTDCATSTYREYGTVSDSAQGENLRNILGKVERRIKVSLDNGLYRYIVLGSAAILQTLHFPPPPTASSWPVGNPFFCLCGPILQLPPKRKAVQSGKDKNTHTLRDRIVFLALLGTHVTLSLSISLSVCTCVCV